jgi:hypothetical protein
MSQVVYEATAGGLAFSADGECYQIIEVTKFTILGARPGAGRKYQKIACGAALKTACGMGAERLAKGRYFIPQLGIVVVSDDANAP